MSLRLRFILIIFIMATLPVLITVFQATSFMEQQTVVSGQKALEEIGKAQIYDEALTTAQQIKAYLDQHTHIRLFDMATLLANEELAALAVQPVGKTGYTVLLDVQGITYFHPNPNIVGVDMSTLADAMPEFWKIIERALAGEVSEGYYDWQEPDGSVRQKYMVVVPVEGTRFRVAATTYLDEFLAPGQRITEEIQQVTSATRQRFILSALVTGVVSLLIAILIGTTFTRPLEAMADAARRVMQGEWDAIQPTQRRDELGVLHRAFYNMTSQLRASVRDLEQQVVERTERLERRARYLEATAEVAREASSVLDIDILLARVANLVADEFGVYHVGLFLLDAAGGQIELRAASSPGGRRMLERGCRLPVDAQSLVGAVASQGTYRVALDVGENAVSFDNPDLPGTRSEIVLALRARGEIIGVLDVQSHESEAFSEEDVVALQALADQVAVAINNAFLFQRAQESAAAERRARGELEFEAWQTLLRAQPELSVRSTQRATESARDVWRPEMAQVVHTSRPVADDSGTRLALPVQIGGHVIGVVQGRKSEQTGAWTTEEQALLETLTEQLGTAIERARLYRETQRAAARERTIAETTSRLREPIELADVLKTAVEEIRRAVDMDELVVRLTSPNAREDAAE